MKRLLILLIFIPFISSAQNRGDNWAVSDSILLTFNGNNTIVRSSVLHNSTIAHEVLECMATVSDDIGQLLFYTDATTVWNRENKIMLNGDSLQGSYTITNGVLIVPYPSHDSLYYIFYLGNPDYAIINMNLDSGLGGVIKKNIQLGNRKYPLTEKLCAVKHANGRDWWLIGDTIVGNAFYKFLITPDGIYGPYWQNIGLNQWTFSQGEICFSKNGDKLGIVNARAAEIFDFDRCSGELSNNIVLDSVPIHSASYPYFYGCSFSPNGSKFYASTVSQSLTGVSSNLYQFDLNNTVPSSTKTLIWHDPNYSDTTVIDSIYVIGQHELAPNGKIYITVVYNNTPDSKHYSYQNMNLSVINEPDSLGLACGFKPYSLYLGGHRTTAGLPNMPNYNLDTLFSAGTVSLSKDSICAGTGVRSIINANGTDGGDLQWQSSMDSIHFSSLINDTLNSYTTPNSLSQTTYYRLMAGSYPCIDSSNVVAIHVIPPPFTSFKDSTNGSEVFFAPDSSSAGITSYHWDFGDDSTSALQNPIHTYIASKTYYVCLTVYNGSNCSYTTCQDINYSTGVVSVAAPSAIQLYPNPAGDELTIEISDNAIPKQILITDALGRTLLQVATYKSSTQVNINSLSAGIYFVKVQMNDGSVEVRKFVKE